VTPHAGSTTVALCLARRVGAQQAHCLLVDADLANPKIVSRLGVASSAGWESMLNGEHEQGETLIESLEDRFAVAPLTAATIEPHELASSAYAPGMFDSFAQAYDLVLFDAGSPTMAQIEALAMTANLDAAYMIYDARSTAIEVALAEAGRLRALGLNVAGAIANFAPLPTTEEPTFQTP
jgi:Mrp family chromosome partitioning ATPase